MTKQNEASGPLQAVAALPRTVAPGRDLWPGIQARLTQRNPAGAEPKRRPGWYRQALAAAVLSALAIGLFMGHQYEPPPDQQTEALAQEHYAVPTSMALQAAVQITEREYQAAFREFIPVGARHTLVGPEAMQSIESSWQEVQQAEIALQAALADYPDNTYLNQRLLDLRSQQLAFMQQLAMLDQFGRRKT